MRSAGALIAREVGNADGAIEGRDPAEIAAALEPRRGPERILDLMLRVGAHGDGFGARPDGLTLERLESSPHGIDLGAHESRLPDVLRTPSGRIELAPEPITRDVGRLRTRLDAGAWNGAGPEMVLIGRRQLRSNNSWMHNLNALVKGIGPLHGCSSTRWTPSGSAWRTGGGSACARPPVSSRRRSR